MLWTSQSSAPLAVVGHASGLAQRHLRSPFFSFGVVHLICWQALLGRLTHLPRLKQAVAVTQLEARMSETSGLSSTPEPTSSAPRLRRKLAAAALFTVWVAAIPTVPPHVLKIGGLAGGLGLATIYAWRRGGSPFARAEAAIAFFVGALVVALHTELVARVTQFSLLSSQHWHPLDTPLELLAIAAGLPIVAFVVFVMWRSWDSV